MKPLVDLPRITTVIATSPIPSMPGITVIRQTIDSLKLIPELDASPILIVFDGPRENSDPVRAAYDQYKENIRHHYCDRPNIACHFLPDWGHLSGVMNSALTLVRTPFLFVQQHDLPLVRSFELDAVIECLTHDPLVKYVRLNRRHNRAVCWDRNALFAAYETPDLRLTRTACWSDQCHIASAAYYREIVLPEVANQKVFVERVLNRKMALPAGPELNAAHRRYGTFIYGGPGEPPVIRHTDGKHWGVQSKRDDNMAVVT